MRFAKLGGCLILPLVLFGCGKGSQERAVEKQAERAIEKSGGGKVDVDVSDSGIQIKSENGKMSLDAGASVTVDKDFPSDVLVYANAKVVMQSRSGTNFNLSLTSKEPMATIVSAYQEKMKESGWEEAAKTQTPETTLLQFKKEKRAAMINVTSDGTESQIMVLVATEE